jgi:hypothetical protein
VKSLPSTDIIQGNLRAISFKLNKGESNGGISGKALADFLCHTADRLKDYEDKVKELELEVIRLKETIDVKA